MFPFPPTARKAGSAARFVGVTQRAADSAGYLTWPVGAAIGDYAFVFVPYNGAIGITNGSGWSTSSISQSSTFLNINHKELTAGDLTTPPYQSATLGRVSVLLYRGVHGASVKTPANASGTTLTVPGFAKSTACKGLISATIDRTGGGSGAIGTPPPYMTSRSQAALESFFCSHIADFLSPAAYTGAGLAWTDFDSAGGFNQVGVAIELT